MSKREYSIAKILFYKDLPPPPQPLNFVKVCRFFLFPLRMNSSCISFAEFREKIPTSTSISQNNDE